MKAPDVDTVVVKMPAEAHDYVGGTYRPGDSPQVSAQFNTAYNVAAALIRGRVGLAEFDLDTLLNPEFQQLADRVETMRSDEQYCFGPQEITIRLRNGSTLSRNVSVMKGHPDNPMQDHHIEDKFMALAEPALGKDRSRTALESWWRVKDAQHVGALMNLVDIQPAL